MASSNWLSKHSMCAQLGQQILEKINERNREAKTSGAYAKISSEIRISLRQFITQIQSLRNELVRSASTNQVTEKEGERRQNMLDDLVSKQKHIEQVLEQDSASAAVGRSDLLGATSLHSSRGLQQANMDQDGNDGYGDMPISHIRDQQQQIIREQDEGLEALSSVIAKQKGMAITIGTEVSTQNEMIDDIHDHVDRTNERLIKETRHISIVDRKSATCGYWMVIILLLIAIVVVSVVPN